MGQSEEKNFSFQVRIFNIFETWPHAISVSISWAAQDRGRLTVQKQLCSSKPLFLHGDSQKSWNFCVTKLQVGPCANELGSLTWPDLQDTRSSPKEAETTSTIGKNNSFRAYFEALHMQCAPDYLICIFSQMHPPPSEDLTEHHYTADLVISYIPKIFKLESKCELACSIGCQRVTVRRMQTTAVYTTK